MDISIIDLHTFFKDLKSPNDSPEPDSGNVNFSIENYDDILTCHISENQILKCVYNLNK